LICTLVSAESPPEKIAPWRAATRTGGVEAVAFAPDGQSVYACGPEKSRRRYHLDGHRYPPKAKGGARATTPSEEDSPLLVLRWGLTGSQLADMPLWHFHHTPLRLGILIGLALGALGSCYFMACPEHSDLRPGLARDLDVVFRVGLGFSLLLSPLLLIPSSTGRCFPRKWRGSLCSQRPQGSSPGWRSWPWHVASGSRRRGGAWPWSCFQPASWCCCSSARQVA